MNQILYTNYEKKKGGPLEMNTLYRIFGILLIVFGIIIISSASFAMLNKESTSKSVPLVEILDNQDSLLLKISHDKIIDKIVYNWNEDNQEIILQGRGRNNIEETIELPVGFNVLYLKVTDIEGKTVSYSQAYERPEGDVISPEIELLVDGSKIRIVAKDETELSHIIYYWNQEDETRIDVREDSLKQIEEKVSTLKGENVLTVIAIDEAGNETKKEQTIKGATKPIIELSKTDNQLFITISDEEGLKKVEYILNGESFSTDPNNEGTSINMKKIKITQVLQGGENKITVKAYNLSGLVTEQTGEITI